MLQEILKCARSGKQETLICKCASKDINEIIYLSVCKNDVRRFTIVHHQLIFLFLQMIEYFKKKLLYICTRKEISGKIYHKLS